MTLDEFTYEIDTWETLIDFCQEHCCDICEDIIHADNLKEAIEEELKACVAYSDWTEIRDALYAIDEFASFYIHHNDLEFEEADQFLLTERIQATEIWAVQNDIFEEPDQDDDAFPSLFDDDDDDDDDDGDDDDDLMMLAINSFL